MKSPHKKRATLYLIITTALPAACSNFPNYQTPYNEQNPLYSGPTLPKTSPDKASTNSPSTPKFSSQGYRFASAYAAAKDNPTQAKLRAFMEAGMTYEDLLCSHYFSKIDFTRAHREYAQKQSTLAGSLTTALLGLADAGSAVTGAAGAAFGFTSSSFDAYNTAFLASTDIGLLQDLVISAQVQDKREILKRVTATSGIWPDRIDSLDLAISDLNTYISRCTPTGIRNLLKASIRDKTEKQIGKSPEDSERLGLTPNKK
ncbi:hypothetical protein [Pseudomonas sp. NBRC 111119]|uniref:hypothetical protein n=1 Tax=Pseudomonas sp. NBRC 111119 TaxID=1661034 RepID=UPI000A507F2F|nr:hypothetical protein [Pseudomonas sp. NBRC 111119]